MSEIPKISLTWVRSELDNLSNPGAGRYLMKVLLDVSSAALAVHRLHAEATDGFDDESHVDRWRQNMDDAAIALDEAISLVSP